MVWGSDLCNSLTAQLLFRLAHTRKYHPKLIRVHGPVNANVIKKILQPSWSPAVHKHCLATDHLWLCNLISKESTVARWKICSMQPKIHHHHKLKTWSVNYEQFRMLQFQDQISARRRNTRTVSVVLLSTPPSKEALPRIALTLHNYKLSS